MSDGISTGRGIGMGDGIGTGRRHQHGRGIGGGINALKSWAGEWVSPDFPASAPGGGISMGAASTAPGAASMT